MTVRKTARTPRAPRVPQNRPDKLVSDLTTVPDIMVPRLYAFDVFEGSLHKSYPTVTRARSARALYLLKYAGQSDRPGFWELQAERVLAGQNYHLDGSHGKYVHLRCAQRVMSTDPETGWPMSQWVWHSLVEVCIPELPELTPPPAQ